MKDLKDASNFIKAKYKCTEVEYPKLSGLTKDDIDAFNVRHSSLHASKLAGKLAALSEDVDHGSELDREKAKDIIVKQLINVLILADRLDIEVEDLVAEIPEKK